MGWGDYSRKRVIFQDCSTDRNFAATDGNLTLITGKTNKTIYVQKIIVIIKTSAAFTITFEDTNGSPVYVAKIPINPAADSRWEFDMGPDGKGLTTATNLQMTMTAGNAGHVEVQAYFKPDSVMTVGTNN